MIDWHTWGQTWAGPVDIQQAYAWKPAIDGTTEEDVLGVEGTLFTEYITNEERLDLMVWPRLAALAELNWSPDELTLWPQFEPRLAWHGARLEVLEVGYYRSPEIAWISAADAQ